MTFASDMQVRANADPSEVFALLKPNRPASERIQPLPGTKKETLVPDWITQASVQGSITLKPSKLPKPHAATIRRSRKEHLAAAHGGAETLTDEFTLSSVPDDLLSDDTLCSPDAFSGTSTQDDIDALQEEEAFEDTEEALDVVRECVSASLPPVDDMVQRAKRPRASYPPSRRPSLRNVFPPVVETTSKRIAACLPTDDDIATEHSDGEVEGPSTTGTWTATDAYVCELEEAEDYALVVEAERKRRQRIVSQLAARGVSDESDTIVRAATKQHSSAVSTGLQKSFLWSLLTALVLILFSFFLIVTHLRSIAPAPRLETRQPASESPLSCNVDSIHYPESSYKCSAQLYAPMSQWMFAVPHVYFAKEKVTTKD
jgi:hypothetical protein